MFIICPCLCDKTREMRETQKSSFHPGRVLLLGLPPSSCWRHRHRKARLVMWTRSYGRDRLANHDRWIELGPIPVNFNFLILDFSSIVTIVFATSSSLSFTSILFIDDGLHLTRLDFTSCRNDLRVSFRNTLQELTPTTKNISRTFCVCMSTSIYR